MFKGLQDTIKALNAVVSNVANCEKAKKLRRTLLSIGIPMAAVGFIGLFTCFVLFATAGMDAFGPNGFTARIMVPFILFIPCGLIGGIGASIASLGFKIVVTGYTTNLINETVGNVCPNCKANINPDMPFCKKCGYKLVNTCPSCNHENDHQSEFCEKCGTKLN